MTFRIGLRGVEFARSRWLEDASTASRAQKQPVEIEWEARVAASWSDACTRRSINRRPVGNEDYGARRVRCSLFHHRHRKHEAAADIRRREAGPVDHADGRLHHLVVVGERHDRHRRTRKCRDADTVVRPVRDEVRDETPSGRRLRLVFAGRAAAGEAVVHAGRPIDQEHDVGPPALALDHLLAAGGCPQAPGRSP